MSNSIRSLLNSLREMTLRQWLRLLFIVLGEAVLVFGGGGVISHSAGREALSVFVGLGCIFVSLADYMREAKP
jgi:hypothetical protein